MKIISIFFAVVCFLFANEYYIYNGNGEKIKITPLNVESSKTITTSNKYQTDLNQTIKINNKIILVTKENLDIEILQEKYNFQFLKKINTKYIVVEVAHNNIFEILEQLNKEDTIEYAYPDYAKSVYKR